MSAWKNLYITLALHYVWPFSLICCIALMFLILNTHPCPTACAFSGRPIYYTMQWREHVHKMKLYQFFLWLAKISHLLSPACTWQAEWLVLTRPQRAWGNMKGTLVYLCPTQNGNKWELLPMCPLFICFLPGKHKNKVTLQLLADDKVVHFLACGSEAGLKIC